MQINENLVKVFAQLFPTDTRESQYVLYDLCRRFSDEIPQMNHRTKIQMTYRGPHEMEIPIDMGGRNIRSFSHHWYPKAGIKAFYLRLVKRVHKWLVDNRYHPADRPQHWHPMDITSIGMIDISPDQYMPLMPTRRIEFKQYGFSTPGAYSPMRPDYFYIICAYDPLSDTLFVQDLAR